MRATLFLCFVVGLVVCSSPLAAKDEPTELNWPRDGQPILHFQFAKFKRTKAANQEFYTVEVTAVNQWDKVFDASFDMFVFDKNKTRVGQGYVNLAHVRPAEKVKFDMSFSTTGEMATFQLVPRQLPDALRALGPVKMVKVTIYSVPAGSALMVDGKPSGTTPAEIKVAAGKHDLAFSHEGYRNGHYELLVTDDQVDGGSLTYELGGLAGDTIEMRDGTVLVGDVLYLDGNTVAVRVGGTTQNHARNMVKKIILVEREPVAEPVGSSK